MSSLDACGPETSLIYRSNPWSMRRPVPFQSRIFGMTTSKGAVAGQRSHLRRAETTTGRSMQTGSLEKPQGPLGAVIG